jgi:MFS family permease
LALLIAGGFTGYLTCAWLADRIGRRCPLFLIVSAGAIMLVLC